LTPFFARHPVVPLSVRAAAAAMVAWLVVLPLGGVADRYAYYAPLGAVVSVSTTVTQSIRASAQTCLALVLGAGLGVAAQLAPVPQMVALGLVVGLGSVAAAWPRLGVMGSWVPVSALFVLILGQGEPWTFVLGYLGLTTLGAAVGVVVNAAVPPLPLAMAQNVQDSLRTDLVEQLDNLAGLLERDPLPSADEWQARRYVIEPRTRQMQELVSRAAEARGVNWRVRRWQDAAERQQHQARALANLALQVEDMTELLAHREHAEGELALGPGLRPTAARALRATAAALRSVDGPAADGLAADDAALRQAEDAADDFALAIRSERSRSGDDLFPAGTLLTGVRRALLSVASQPGDAT
jgi:uncharacterized membrane protein YgaE (UPF0421/DUF939 family)